jgi:hypothetical protein
MPQFDTRPPFALSKGVLPLLTLLLVSAANVPPPSTDGAPSTTGATAAADPASEEAAADGSGGDAVATGSGPRWRRPGFGFGGVPALGYDPDFGFMFGAVGSIFHYDGDTAPYRNRVKFQILLTHKLVQDHALELDALRFLDLPLRLTARLGFNENLGQNYCGLGADVTCDPDVAHKTADALGLEGEARELLLRRFYVYPYISPNAALNLRFRLATLGELPRQMKIELMGGWRGAQYIPGTIFDDDGDGHIDLYPYPYTRYAADFPGGEPGFASIVQAGIFVDRRDNEPSPRHGWLAEASVRGSSPAIGSTWSFAGANLTLRGYTPLAGDPRLVLAVRLILDGVVGDLPVAEMVRIGGSEDYAGYGGVDLGRGIRGQRYAGRIKVLEQQELRWHFFDFEALGQSFGLILNGFLDAGFVALALDDLGSRSPQLPIGFGGAFAISWNEAFILRLDLAASSAEGYSPYPYITLGQSF